MDFKAHLVFRGDIGEKVEREVVDVCGIGLVGNLCHSGPDPIEVEPIPSRNDNVNTLSTKAEFS
jgi:hypothetical protein